MTMRKRVGSVLITLSAAVLAVGMSASSAMAATTLKVKVTNGGSYTAKAAKTVLTNRGASVTCTASGTTPASKATGTVASGTHTGASPVSIGKDVKTLNFRNCTGPLGHVTTTVHGLPYTIKVDSTTTSTGKTDGMITGVNVHVSMTGCSFDVKGSAPGYYDNATHKLHMTTPGNLPKKPLNTARLTVSGVSGCATLVQNGDHPTYKGTYTLSRAIKIKSTKV